MYYGPDTFSRGEALVALRRELDTDGMLATNTAVFSGRAVKPEELMAACDTVPFLAAHRLVVVEGLLSAQEGTQRVSRSTKARPQPAQGTASPWAVLQEYVQRMPPTSELLLTDGDVKDGNWLFSALRPLAEVRIFPPLRGEALQHWITERVHRRKAAIQPRAAAVLAERVAGNLWQMENEIEKLSLYAYDRPIEVADVRSMVSVPPTGTAFQLVDAVMAAQGNEALRLVHLLMDGGEPGPRLLVLLANQLRQLLVAQDLIGRGTPRAEIGRALESRSDWALARNNTIDVISSG